MLGSRRATAGALIRIRVTTRRTGRGGRTAPHPGPADAGPPALATDRSALGRRDVGAMCSSPIHTAAPRSSPFVAAESAQEARSSPPSRHRRKPCAPTSSPGARPAGAAGPVVAATGSRP
ncbi:hypothetical protein ACFPM0_15975 [Pseudonocardia sulfidoxydans]|uniref:hypothetical protein n=1 Tax=Pseudonocardia sulfidoxydans TaxID=54011 RepID=UPI00361CC458